MENRDVSHSANRQVYEFSFILGLILFIIQDYLNDCLAVPDIISQDCVNTCRIASIILMILAIIYGICRYFYKVKELIMATLILVAIIIVERQYDPIEYSVRNVILNYRLLPVFVIFLAARKIEFRKICLTMFLVSSVMMTFVVALRYLGKVPDLYLLDEGRPLHPYRFNLGFRSFGTSSIRYINIFFTGIYSIHWYKKRLLNVITLFAFGAVAAFFYYQTQTKLAFAMVILGIGGYIYLEKMNVFFSANVEKLMSSVLATLFFVFPVTLSSICYYIDCVPQSVYNIINRVLTGRLALNHRALTEYPITAWGVRMKFVGFFQDEPYFYVDSGYVRSMIEFGVILFLVVLFVYSYIAYHSVGKKDRFLVCWIVLLCVYNILNNLFFSVVTNTMILSFWYLYDLERNKAADDKLPQR